MTAERRRADKKLVAAHDRVCQKWPTSVIEELDPLIVNDPLFEADAPSDLAEAFYREREAAKKDIEMEPVTETFAGTAVVVDWKPAE